MGGIALIFGITAVSGQTPGSTAGWPDLAGGCADPMPYHSIPSHFELAARQTRKPVGDGRVSLVGRNLLRGQHHGYDSASNRELTANQRSIFVILRSDF